MWKCVKINNCGDTFNIKNRLTNYLPMPTIKDYQFFYDPCFPEPIPAMRKVTCAIIISDF